MKMIKNLIFTFLFLLVNFSSYAQISYSHLEKTRNQDTISEESIQLSKTQTVYVCTGAYAYAYHSRTDCSGLKNCKGDINSTDEYTAVNSFGRRPCCRCWSNVINNCKDDNLSSNGGSGGGGSNGGSGNSEAYAYIALAIVATSVIILSNDVYLYPTYSFPIRANPNNYYGQSSDSGKGTGWIFGFRKTFKRSALEYGLSYLQFETKYNYGNSYIYSSTQNRLGIHLNYVHQIFYDKTPEWLKVYLGPSFNDVFDFGYGGIIGAEMKLLNRLKFDFRFERTTQTNQIQGGLIFTYQRKYFWQ
jgi:hypothetical protein